MELEELKNRILELCNKKMGELKYQECYFGRKFKAYKNNFGKVVVCSCEKEALANKIEIFNMYKESYFHKKEYSFYDYIYGSYHKNISLEDFLGLPKELKIDYTKDVLSQITFEENICHRCLGVDYSYLIPVKNPFNNKYLKKQKRDACRDIEKENYFFSKGVYYIPVQQMMFVLVHKLNEASKEIIKPTISDFKIQEVEYERVNGENVKKPNSKAGKQKEELQKLLTMPIDDLLKFVYLNLDKNEHEKIANMLDTNFVDFRKNPNYSNHHALYWNCMEGLNKKVRALQSKFLQDFPYSNSLKGLVKELYYKVIKDPQLLEEESFIKFLHKYLDLGGDINVSLIINDVISIKPIVQMIKETENQELIKKAGLEE